MPGRIDCMDLADILSKEQIVTDLQAALETMTRAHARALGERISAAVMVVDHTTGEVLARSNDRERLPIASITKLMTVLVALKHSRLDEFATVSRDAAEVGERPAERGRSQSLRASSAALPI